MAMPSRGYSATSSYRYGFNGKERDKDISSADFDFGARIYDGRIGKWLSVDPLQATYPSFSGYQYCANSPVSSKDPDGRLIIFINGLWGPPTGISGGGTSEYWGFWGNQPWTKAAQDAIGDHKAPLYYDGAMGGTTGYKYSTRSNLPEKIRIAVGYKVGYAEAQSIIKKLDKGETIKIITNSMGTAFERGFSNGLMQYKNDRLGQLGTELAVAEFEKMQIEKSISPERLKELQISIMVQPKTDIEKKYTELADKINSLNIEKQKLESLQIEMVIDLSSHQTDQADPNAKTDYYMIAKKMNVAERIFVREKRIKGGKFLGYMDEHHASNADPNKFPRAANPN